MLTTPFRSLVQWKQFPVAAVLALTLVGSRMPAEATAVEARKFHLFPASEAIAQCLPQAHADVTVLFTEETLGGDIFRLQASGLAPRATFAVFLTQKTAFQTTRFGAVQYIGDFVTDGEGSGAVELKTIVEEAFASTLVGEERIRKELDNVIFWFADPADDICTNAVTPFDGDGEAGGAVMSSKNAPLQ
jgi:hypothetical protein